MSLHRSFLAALAVVLACVPAASAVPTKVVPDRDWVAVIRDEKLKKVFPRAGVITDARTFEKVWKAWRPTEKVPAIDFTKQFVVVTLASGPNRPFISAILDEGNLKITARQTLIGGEGFGYSLATFNRKGVKSVNGKKLP